MPISIEELSTEIAAEPVASDPTPAAAAQGGRDMADQLRAALASELRRAERLSAE